VCDGTAVRIGSGARVVSHMTDRGEEPPSKARTECTADGLIRRKARAPATVEGLPGLRQRAPLPPATAMERTAFALITPRARRLCRCEQTRYTTNMKLHRSLFVFALLTIALLAGSCRAAQINKLDERVDKLESRTAALEAQVAMLTKK
jgi:hypothetical protein